MKYMGYEIISRPHPTPVNRNRRGYDIEFNGNRKMTNVSTIDMCQHVIDTMLERGMWNDKMEESKSEGESK